MLKRAFLMFSVSSVALLSQPAFASSWWDKAKSAINSEAGQSVVGEVLGDSGTGGNLSASGLASSEISSGLREALEISAKHVVAQLGQANGFNADSNIRIPLPDTLARVDQALSTVGMGSLTEDLELRLNRAAEAATPKAKALFITAIKNMTISDAKNILTGPNDAATSYLRSSVGSQLESDMQPIIQNALSSAGAVQAYDQVMGRYGQIPFMPDVKANLNDYVTDKAMDGIFYYIAQEETAIRTNPAKRTTDLLQKVFAGD